MGLGARLFTPESPRPTLESAPDHDQRSSRRPHRWLVSSCAKGVQLQDSLSLTPPESHQSIIQVLYAPLIMPTLSLPCLSPSCRHIPPLCFGGSGGPELRYAYHKWSIILDVLEV